MGCCRSGEKYDGRSLNHDVDDATTNPENNIPNGRTSSGQHGDDVNGDQQHPSGPNANGRTRTNSRTSSNRTSRGRNSKPYPHTKHVPNMMASGIEGRIAQDADGRPVAIEGVVISEPRTPESVSETETLSLF